MSEIVAHSIDGIAIYRRAKYSPETLTPNCSTVLTGDNDYTMVNLPWGYRYWRQPNVDQEHFSCYISTNGWIAFEDIGSPDHVNTFSKLKERRMIAPFWDDLVTRGNHVRTESFTNPDRFVVDWEAHRYGDTGSTAAFQVVLYRWSHSAAPGGHCDIRFNYRYFGNRYAFSPTVGLGRGRSALDGAHLTRTFDLLSFDGSLRGPAFPLIGLATAPWPLPQLSGCHLVIEPRMSYDIHLMAIYTPH